MNLKSRLARIEKERRKSGMAGTAEYPATAQWLQRALAPTPAMADLLAARTPQEVGADSAQVRRVLESLGL